MGERRSTMADVGVDTGVLTDRQRLGRRGFVVGAAAFIAACSGSDDGSTSGPGTSGPAAEPGVRTSVEPAADPGDAIVTAQPDVPVEAAVIEDAVEAVGARAAGVSTPTGAIITRWKQDPFARGSYSYLAAAAVPDDRDLLRADVDGAVFFAGEATSNEYAATVHGAVIEGRGAADRIMAEAEVGDEIAVIGAGAAGLAAARRLADEGFDVFVIEGRDRIGGRVHSDASLGFAVDLGASWIHGADDNPLTELAAAAGIRTAITDPENSVTYDVAGERVDDATLDEVMTLLDEIEADDPRTIEEILVEGLDDLDADDATVRLARYLTTSEIEHEESGPITDLRPIALDVGSEFDGDELLFPDGYVGVLGPLADGLSIATGQVVDSISIGADEIVTIGLIGGAQITADRVLVTVPLGVLKSGDITFVPELTIDKRGAIERLGMGVLDKVYLRFEERFWDEVDLIGFVGNEPGLFVEWYDMTEVVGEPVLLGFNAADVAESVEALTDQQIVEAAMSALITIYGE